MCDWKPDFDSLNERVTKIEARMERVTAALLTTKAIYQAFIDAIDRIKQRLDQEGD